MVVLILKKDFVGKLITNNSKNQNSIKYITSRGVVGSDHSWKITIILYTS